MEYNHKTLGQILSDALVGNHIRLFKVEYSEHEYGEHDKRPKFHYENFFHGGYESVICEIKVVQISNNKDEYVRLILSDDGEFASIGKLALKSQLQFV